VGDTHAPTLAAVANRTSAEKLPNFVGSDVDGTAILTGVDGLSIT
jgi:hypothetical protein